MPKRRTRVVFAVAAAVVLAWLASQRSYVHRSRLDPAAPVYASNYLEARGFVFPWLIVEVPAELGAVPLTSRIDVTAALILASIAAVVAAIVAGLVELVLYVWRRMTT